MLSNEESIRTIHANIASGNLLSPSYFEQLDCNAVLDRRDGDQVFDAKWTRLFNELERRWSEAEIGAAARKLADEIRRDSFMTVSQATKQHEIASYVSDDFDLIIRGKLVGMNDTFVDQLWAVYQRGEFPCPPLPK